MFLTNVCTWAFFHKCVANVLIFNLPVDNHRELDLIFDYSLDSLSYQPQDLDLPFARS